MVFEPCTQRHIDVLLRQFPVSGPGRKYIQDALEAPSRNVAGGTRNVVTNVPNPKMGAVTQGESHTGEQPFILAYMFDYDCVGFSTQSKALHLAYRGKNNRTIRTGYTPDCLLLHRKLGFVVEEWKPGSERGRLQELYPGRYQIRADGTVGSDAVDAEVCPMGLSFRLRFSDEVDGVAHRNRAYLYTFLQPRAASAYAPQFEGIRNMFSSRCQWSIGDLVDRGCDRSALHWAIATGRLHFDWDGVALADGDDSAQLFLHEATFKAWSAAIRPDGGRPSVHRQTGEDKLKPGDSFLLDGKRLLVRFVGNTSLIAMGDDGTKASLTFEELRLAGANLVLHIADAVTRPSRFYTASIKALNEANRRLEILTRYEMGEQLSRSEMYSATTFRRWRRNIKEAEAKNLSPIEALIDDSDKKGYRGSHIDAEESAELNKEISERLKDPINKHARQIYGDIETEWKAKGRRMIALSSFYERVKKLRTPTTISAAAGHKSAYQVEPAHYILRDSTPVHGGHAMAFLHMDSTLLDVEVRSSLSGDILGRPWVTLCICSYSRKVLGFHLSFRPPSYVSSMSALADVIKRTGRIPDAVVHDWGSEFKAKDFKEFLAAMLIQRWVRPKSAPRFGSVIERMFGVTTRMLIDNIVGNTKARRNVRGLSRSHDPSRFSGLWLIDVYLGLEEFFFGVYNGKKHPATLLPPDAMYDESLIQHGQRLHRQRNLEDLLPIIAPLAKGQARVLDTARGLFVNYRHYSNPILTQPHLNGGSFFVRPLPFDPCHVLTFVNGGWVMCKAAMHPSIAAAPPLVKRCFYEEWSIEQQLVGREGMQSRQQLTALIEKMNARALENQSYWTNREFWPLLQGTILGERDVAFEPSSTPSSLASFNATMELVVSESMARQKHHSKDMFL